MDYKLNKEEVIKLISLYRSHEVLWDMNSKLYRRNDLKIKAYENIASEMGMTAETAKKKIRSLRTTYTAEKRKIYNKSGSSAEDVYTPSLFWFAEMRFLDNTIAVRKSCDNSQENSETSENFEDFFEEVTQNDIPKNKMVKRPRKDENSKFDEALNKLIRCNESENEFTSFGTSIAFQLQKLPENDAYETMGEIQNLLVQRKLKIMRNRIFRPIPTTENCNSSTPLESSNICSSESPFDFVENESA